MNGLIRSEFDTRKAKCGFGRRWMGLSMVLIAALLLTACAGSASFVEKAASEIDTALASSVADAEVKSVPQETNLDAKPLNRSTETIPAGQAKDGPNEAVITAKPVPEPVEVNSIGEAQVPTGDTKTTTSTYGSLDELDTMAIVAAQEKALGDIYASVLPSVVQIRVSQKVVQKQEPPDSPEFRGSPFQFDRSMPLPEVPQEFYRRSEGSGFVWDNQGHIVTNHHVIEGADRVTVIFADGTQLEAQVLGSDPDSDLAVLKVESSAVAGGPVPLAESAALRVGQMAVAIGNPFGQEFTMTSGIVSALGRTIRSGNSSFSIPEVIQTDAAINPGNSGGPLLDRKGHVIGVNTQIISRSGANAGIGFAVPIDTAKRVVPSLIADGRYDYAWLGISGTSLNPDVSEVLGLPAGSRGVLVVDVAKDSPAEQAGLKGSDKILKEEGVEYPLGGHVIVSIDDFPISGIDDLISYLIDNTQPGQEVTLEVISGQGEREEIKVTLGKRPEK